MCVVPVTHTSRSNQHEVRGRDSFMTQEAKFSSSLEGKKKPKREDVQIFDSVSASEPDGDLLSTHSRRERERGLARPPLVHKHGCLHSASCCLPPRKKTQFTQAADGNIISRSKMLTCHANAV